MREESMVDARGITKERLRALQECARRAISVPGDALDKKRQNIKTAFGKTSGTMVLFSSTPLQNALSTNIFQALCAVMILIHVYQLSTRAVMVLEGGEVSFRHFRVTGSCAVNGNNRAALLDTGPTWFGMRSSVDPESISVGANSVLLSYGIQSKVSGWFFQCPKSVESVANLAFNLEGSQDLVEWTPIVTAAMEWRNSEWFTWPMHLTAVDGSQTTFQINFRAPWQWVVLIFSNGLSQSIMMCTVMVLARLQMNRQGVLAFVGMFCLTGTNYFFRAISMGSEMGAINLVVSIFFFSMCYLLLTNQMTAIYIFAASGFLDLYVGIQKVSQNYAWSDVFFNHFGPGTLVVGIFLVGGCHKIHTLRKSLSIVRPFQISYQQAWSEISSKHGKEIADLEEFVDSLSLSKKKVRQLWPHSESIPNVLGLRMKSYGRIKESDEREGTLCQSLDVLFQQAQYLQHVLSVKVEELALQTDAALLSTTKDRGYLKFSEVVAGRASQEDVKFASVKDVGRAIEKLVRSYSDDASNLTDLCRSTLIFSSPKGILECLRLMQQDPELKLLRIKNRMAVGYDANKSLGYRDVNVNLCISNEETHSVSAMQHIMEVILLPEPFAELKSLSGHAAYVGYRNLRVE